MRANGRKIAYGLESEQWYEWYEPSALAKGVVVLVHGGFWRQQHNLDQMHRLADFFLAEGWAVANMEYRRADCGGAWPHIINDVNQAFIAIREQAIQKQITGLLVGVGHSVGGQLVLLAAQQQDLVIALAPVTDVARTAKEDLGESAAVDFFGSRVEEVNLDASPIHQLPLATPVLLVHGTDDVRVPLRHSEDFVQALQNGAGNVDFWVIDGLDHFHIIDPACAIWPNVLAYLAVN